MAFFLEVRRESGRVEAKLDPLLAAEGASE
jgi:hypothetical protein